MSEGSLVGDGGEGGGLEAELARAMPRLQAHLARRVRSGEAEELAQETAARVLRYRSGFDERQALWPWLRRVADHVLVDHFRSREPARPEALPDERRAPETEPDVESHEQVARLVATLSGPERAALLRFHVRGESIEEVAAALSLPQGTVKSHLSRARRRLAEDAHARTTEFER